MANDAEQAAVRPALSRKYSVSGIGEAKISRVEQSWYIISGKIDEVGERFFVDMFTEHPEILRLFPFGEDSTHASGRLKMNERTRAHVRAHATAVMRVVGTCVAGLTSIEDLIPRLRTVGSTHKGVGVESKHYDILYRYLVRAIRDQVGPDHWDQQTEDAWEQAFVSISDMMKRPSKRLETEPLQGWGMVMLVACTYFMIVTPFRFAGFLHGHTHMVALLDLLDGLGAAVMAMDLLIHFLQTRLRTKLRSSVSGDHRLQKLFFQQRNQIYSLLQSYRMDRWVPWSTLDAQVLLSFPLQWIYTRSNMCAQIGLHYTHLFGLLRMLTTTRVVHFLQCAENNALIEQKLNADRQRHLRIAKLLLRLAYIIHVSACMWCAVARLQLGVDATEFQPSPFFPSEDIIDSSENDVMKSYSRAVHWAFVNLSGIGGVQSDPVSTMEVWFVLIVHAIGAVFYAVITGNVIAILEEQTKRENQLGTDVFRLSSYLDAARVTDSSKERIMQGFMMRNVLTQPGQRASDACAPDLDDEILNTLPNYLRAEVGIYARAELIRRHDKFFAHCSQGFLLSLSSLLSRSRTLLAGDYLMRKGELYESGFVLVEAGSLLVRHGHNTIATLERGACIGKAWLLQLKSNPQDSDSFHRKTDWMADDGTAAVSIRALSPCTLLTGLSTVEDIQKLEQTFRPDFQLLRIEARRNDKSRLERQAIAVKVIGNALRRYSERKQEQSEQEAKRTPQNSNGDELASR